MRYFLRGAIFSGPWDGLDSSVDCKCMETCVWEQVMESGTYLGLDRGLQGLLSSPFSGPEMNFHPVMTACSCTRVYRLEINCTALTTGLVPTSANATDGHMMPSQDCLGVLLECVRSAWDGAEDGASCASRFLTLVAGTEQDEQLRRLLSFVEALRAPLSERLEGDEQCRGGEGIVEEASRKRNRGDAGSGQEEGGRGEPQMRRDESGEGEAHPGLSGQSDTAAAVAVGPADMAVHEGMSRAVKGVLLDGDLLGCVWGFVLGGHARQDVRVLGQLSEVCRKWREVAAWDAWWGHIEQDMLSTLWGEETREKAGSSRGRMVQYARFLDEQRHPSKGLGWEGDWQQSLEAHVEMFDRMDGLQMLSMRGYVSLEYDYDHLRVTFRTDSSKFQSRGMAFSAASRDPDGRFLTMRQFLVNGDEDEYPCCPCIRVMLRDTRTGNIAVVGEKSNYLSLDVYEHDGVDGLVVCLEDIHVVGALRGSVGVFYDVIRVPDQAEGVSTRDMLYRVDPYTYRLHFSIGRTSATMNEYKVVLQALLG